MKEIAREYYESYFSKTKVIVSFVIGILASILVIILKDVFYFCLHPINNADFKMMISWEPYLMYCLLGVWLGSLYGLFLYPHITREYNIPDFYKSQVTVKKVWMEAGFSSSLTFYLLFTYEIKLGLIIIVMGALIMLLLICGDIIGFTGLNLIKKFSLKWIWYIFFLHILFVYNPIIYLFKNFLSFQMQVGEIIGNILIYYVLPIIFIYKLTANE